MKKIVILLTVLIVVLSLCACATGDSNAQKETDGRSETGATNNDNVDSEKVNAPKPGIAPVTPRTQVPDGYVGIYTVEDLLKINANKLMNYILMNDLDLSSYPNWQGLLNNAHFDGNGHTISNLRSEKSGLFDECNMVTGLILKNVEINFKYLEDRVVLPDFYIGAIANTIKDSLTNCYAEGYISVRELSDDVCDIYMGGLVGYAENAMISYCTNDVKVFYDTNEVCKRFIDTTCGGIVGSMRNDNSGLIAFCVNNAEIYAYNYTDYDDGMWLDYHGICGGIVGEATSNITINSCVNSGDITSSAIASGIVATLTEKSYDKSCTIKHCINSGKIEISKEEGGVYPTYKLGHKASGILGEVNNSNCLVYLGACYNLGKICGDFKDAGSLVAYSKSDRINIRDCIYVSNSDYKENALSMDGKGGMYPESYNNKEISLTEAKEQFPQYFAD